jgi:conserved oligomeric Golgi complex subunit 6
VIAAQAEEARQNPPLPPPDLSPPALIHQSINHLLEIMSVFDSSLVPPQERVKEFTPILQAALGPLIDSCTLAATVLTQDSDVAVFMINCLGLIQVSLKTILQ